MEPSVIEVRSVESNDSQPHHKLQQSDTESEGHANYATTHGALCVLFDVERHIEITSMVRYS